MYIYICLYIYKYVIIHVYIYVTMYLFNCEIEELSFIKFLRW